MQCTCYPLRKSLNFVKVERKFSHGKQGVGIKWWCINGGWKLKDSVSFTKKWWGNENEAMKITLVCLCPRADWVVPNIRTALLAVSPWDLALWPILFLCNERGWPPVLLSFHLPGHGTQENWTIILLMFPPHGSKRDRHFSHCPEVSAVSPPPFTVSPSRSLWSHATNISKAVSLSFCLSLGGESRLWLGAAAVLCPGLWQWGLSHFTLPPKHNQLCLWDVGTLLGLQPCKWLHTWSPLCLIKPFSSTPGKKTSNILLPPKLLCALDSLTLALLSLAFPLCKMGVQLCQFVEVYKLKVWHRCEYY